ncbi:glycoside hydrolase family 18 protein [Chitinophaga sp. Cy-1792]|uniref:glycoside hydrolase family 18 protein n=1 Tax=Chitinophaga sp. Cy-1792 TaxID=2608339 RepID=UPI00141EE6C1|nr:glycoside hydrolase family 18 protein [Chitinophaga sp. Cy-1792]NIG54795.1 glycoside hydrolase family 18 protein [Chitinophaga sp. Cy-1792]
MKGLLIALLAPALLTATPKKPAADKKAKPVVIGYVGGFRGTVNTDAIAANKLTHINYAFVNVQHNRAVLTNLATDTVNFRNLSALKKINPDLKILISIGGWAWSANFSDAVLTDTSRAAFAKSAVDIIRDYNLDGVDIDWEYPAREGEVGNVFRPEDKVNYTLMFAALRKELNLLEKKTHKKLLLTTATAGFVGFLETTEMGKAQQYLDYVNIMSYDCYSNKFAGHHTNLFPTKAFEHSRNADESIKAYIAAGVPASKLVMGIAFYGRNFKVADSTATATGLGSPIVRQQFGSGYTFIRDSLLTKGYHAYRDQDAKADYLYNPATKDFITCDDEWSVQNKCNYVLDKKMGGVMFWEYSSDKKEYLLDQINYTFSHPGTVQDNIGLTSVKVPETGPAVTGSK